MIPISLQIPAALVLVAGGALACFAGYRLFRIVLGVYGFVLGALVATTIAGASSTPSLLLWAIAGGLLGALLLNLAYFFGVVLVGAAIGAMVVALIWGRQAEPNVAVVILFAVGGAIAAMLLQRYVVITGTAFGGAWTMLVGALALVGDRAAQAAAAANNVWVVYPLDPAPGRRWVPAAWLALGALGCVLQMKQGPTRAKAVKRKKT
jgi:hypothetical protein